MKAAVPTSDSGSRMLAERNGHRMSCQSGCERTAAQDAMAVRFDRLGFLCDAVSTSAPGCAMVGVLQDLVPPLAHCEDIVAVGG
jgi:hypothetical protein